MLTTIVESLHGDASLLTLSTLAFKMYDLPFTVVDTVFKEMVRKLAHVRVQEYLDSYKCKKVLHKKEVLLWQDKTCMILC